MGKYSLRNFRKIVTLSGLLSTFLSFVFRFRMHTEFATSGFAKKFRDS
jgi:hypothetical protein